MPAAEGETDKLTTDVKGNDKQPRTVDKGYRGWTDSLKRPKSVIRNVIKPYSSPNIIKMIE
jgi:hypothetical protein